MLGSECEDIRDRAHSVLTIIEDLIQAKEEFNLKLTRSNRSA